MFLAINLNSNTMLSSSKFKNIVCFLTSKNVSLKHFYSSKPRKIAWKSGEKLFISAPTRAELDLLTSTDKLPTLFY